MPRASFISSVIAIWLTLQMRPAPLGKVRLCATCHIIFLLLVYLLCYSDLVNLAGETCTLGKVRLCATCHICLLCYSDSVNLADDLCSSNQCQNGGECVLLPTAMAGGFRCVCPDGYSGTHCELGRLIIRLF